MAEVVAHTWGYIPEWQLVCAEQRLKLYCTCTCTCGEHFSLAYSCVTLYIIQTKHEV